MAKSAIFRGEGDLMVDALVTASQQRPALPPGGPKVRALTPFFVEGCGANPGLESVNVALNVAGAREGVGARADAQLREASPKKASPPRNGTAAASNAPSQKNQARGRKGKGQQSEPAEVGSSQPASQRTLRLMQPANDGPGAVQGNASAQRSSHDAAAPSGKRLAPAKVASSSGAHAAPAPRPPKPTKSSPQRVSLFGSSPPSSSGASFAGLAKAPEPGALPLPSFGFGRSASDSAVVAPRAAAPVTSAADASLQLRLMLAVPMTDAGAAPAPPPPHAAAQHTMALRQLLGVAAC